MRRFVAASRETGARSARGVNHTFTLDSASPPIKV
jgi:hypothetical protein